MILLRHCGGPASDSGSYLVCAQSGPQGGEDEHSDTSGAVLERQSQEGRLGYLTGNYY